MRKLLLLLPISACATIIDGDYQDIQLTTPNNQEAYCLLEDTAGMKYETKAPSMVSVKMGSGPLSIKCTANNQEMMQQANEELNPWIWGNIGTFGTGAIYDAIIGSYQKYPDEIMIEFAKE